MEPIISMAKIAGNLFGGFAVKLAAIGAACVLASCVYTKIHEAVAPIQALLH